MVMEFPTQDLQRLFDAQVFAGDPRIMVAVMTDDAEAEPDTFAAGLALVRRRAEARIAFIERIAGLDAEQRKKLQVAADTDLRRLRTAVAEVRAKYAGRMLSIDPGHGLDEQAQREMERCTQDAERCRGMVQAACGPDSLLAKVVAGTLDAGQARTYEAAIRGRRTCRWRAVVTAGLVQWDELLGLTRAQHAALERQLLAEPPPLAEEGAEPAAGQVPVFVIVGQRLAALGDAVLDDILDPRQLAAVESQAGPAGGGGMVLEGGMF